LKSGAGVQQSSDSKRSLSNSKKDPIPWSKQLAKKDAKEKRHAQKARKMAWMASTRVSEGHTGPKRTRGDSEEERVDSAEGEEDWASFAAEERAAKKSKKGKVSQAETPFVDM
jgi:hypothetical protein